MLALAVLLYIDPQHSPIALQAIGELLLWIAAGITLYSGWIYVQTSMDAATENLSA
jgi:TRAP-type C4-dicarboxylate transport system permease small subunit